MEKSILLVALAIVNAFFVHGAELTGADWLSDLDRAKQLAKVEKKDLFILFTGHGWCHACEVLEREVLQQTEFAQATSSNYVLVELDLSFGSSEDEVRRERDFKELRSFYLAPAVPTVVLADATGIPYAFITGYDSNTGVLAFLDIVTKARSAKSKRDVLMAHAAHESGESRAKLLDESLDCIAKLLGDTRERGDDPLLHFYGEVITEILKLTGRKGPVANKYTALRKYRDDWFSKELVLKKLEEFSAAKDYAGAINYIDSILKITKNGEMRLQLEWARQLCLESSEKYDEALANVRRLLDLKEIDDAYRGQLLEREACNLFYLGRVDEGLAHFEPLIRAAANEERRHIHILSLRSQLMLGRDPVDQSIKFLTEYRSATKKGTEHWVISSALLARELRRGALHLQAVDVVKEILSERREAWYLLEAAESQIELGNDAEAQQLLNEAKGTNRKLLESARIANRKEYDRIAVRIADLEKKLTRNRTIR